MPDLFRLVRAIAVGPPRNGSIDRRAALASTAAVELRGPGLPGVSKAGDNLKDTHFDAPFQVGQINDAGESRWLFY